MSIFDRFRNRSARTGRFTTAQDAAANPETTVAETVDEDATTIALQAWRIQSLEAAALGAAGDIRNAVMHNSATPDRLSAIAERLEVAGHDHINETAAE